MSDQKMVQDYQELRNDLALLKRDISDHQKVDENVQCKLDAHDEIAKKMSLWVARQDAKGKFADKLYNIGMPIFALVVPVALATGLSLWYEVRVTSIFTLHQERGHSRYLERNIHEFQHERVDILLENMRVEQNEMKQTNRPLKGSRE